MIKCKEGIILIVFTQFFGKPSCIVQANWRTYVCSFQQVYDFQIKNIHFGVKFLMFQWMFPLEREIFYVT
jgi:hypothetical protein